MILSADVEEKNVNAGEKQISNIEYMIRLNLIQKSLTHSKPIR